MRIVHFKSEELVRSHHINETVLKLKFLSKNQRDHNCFCIPLVGARSNSAIVRLSTIKKACLTALALGFEIGESFTAGAARQPGPTESDLRRCRVEHAGYGITDTWDEIVDKMMEIALTSLKVVNERVTELDTTVRQRTDEFKVHFEDA
nr:hypothetical protein [Tanacetum cinerariifolium]